MISIRRSSERGYADHGWLRSFHTFSFADYHDPAHMGFGNLRVINEDRVAPGKGFDKHSHRDMEIVSYVIDGALAHQDSMGNGTPGARHNGVIRPGDVQRMSAGTGVTHSEFNHSADQTTHFLQIWIFPRMNGIQPGYEQKHFDASSKRGGLRLVVSPDGSDGSVAINADASIFAGLFEAGESAAFAIPPGRLVYLHVVRGTIDVNGHYLLTGDAAEFSNEPRVLLVGARDCEVLLFDLALA